MKQGNTKGSRRGLWTLCLVLLLTAAMFLQGCSGGGSKTTEDWLKDMKEFAIPNGAASMYFDKDWITQDMQLDTFLAVGRADGSEAAFLLQFPKNGTIPMENMDALKEFIKTAYSPTNTEAVDGIEVPGMTNLEVISADISSGGQNAKAYIIYGETEYAYYSLGYVASKLNDRIKSSFIASCSKFVEVVPEEEDRTTVEMTDTIRWFNASYAVLMKINGQDYNRFAGSAANDDAKTLWQDSLNQSWGVTDRASADETIDTLLSEGQRTGFAENGEYLQQCGLGDVAEEERVSFVVENFGVSEDEAKGFVDSYAMYEQYGANAIDGWDYCRAMSLMSMYYLADYYTEQEALDKSLEIAQIIQKTFGSWDEMMDSYLRGYEYWAEESSDERRGIYEEIKAASDSPYQLDFKMSLEKTW